MLGNVQRLIILTYKPAEIIVVVAYLFSVAVYDLGNVIATVVGIRVGRSGATVYRARISVDKACLPSFHLAPLRAFLPSRRGGR